MNIIAGEALYNQIQEAKKALVSQSYGLYHSEELCEFQKKMSKFVLGAQVVKSIYGYSVRYDSGLQNFGLIARAQEIGGSLEEAIKFVENWVSQDPSRRYAWISDYDMKEKEGYSNVLY